MIDKFNQKSKGLKLNIAGVMTQFANAEELNIINNPQSYSKIIESEQLFDENVLENSIIMGNNNEYKSNKKIVYHTSNSAYLLSNRMIEHLNNKWKEISCCNYDVMIRVGRLFYGLQPSNTNNAMILPNKIKGVMSWKTKIAQLRMIKKGQYVGYGSKYQCEQDTLVASLPIGFGHGYLRNIAQNQNVLVHGIKCPVIGLPSMNILNVDVTNVYHNHNPNINIKIGDEVVLLGEQGNEKITISDLARDKRTNGEISCIIGNFSKQSASF